jgi:TatD DNase family protein
VVSGAVSGLVDTHCHLNFDVFDHDRISVVERALKSGITRILVPGVDIESSIAAIQCANEFPKVYAAVGVHPNYGASWTNSSYSELRDLAGKEKVVAIGEIGLDYYRDDTPIAIQKSIFQQQLDLAAEVGLPALIHNRDSSIDILNILQEWIQGLVNHSSRIADNPGVMHSFSGDSAYARILVSLNLKIGISGPVTFQKSFELQSVVASLLTESLFIETDAPFLSPHPFRGKRNEPANVRIVAEKIASLKGESLDNVTKITTAEADKLFRWREYH